MSRERDQLREARRRFVVGVLSSTCYHVALPFFVDQRTRSPPLTTVLLVGPLAINLSTLGSHLVSTSRGWAGRTSLSWHMVAMYFTNGLINAVGATQCCSAAAANEHLLFLCLKSAMFSYPMSGVHWLSAVVHSALVLGVGMGAHLALGAAVGAAECAPSAAAPATAPAYGVGVQTLGLWPWAVVALAGAIGAVVARFRADAQSVLGPPKGAAPAPAPAPAPAAPACAEPTCAAKPGSAAASAASGVSARASEREAARVTRLLWRRLLLACVFTDVPLLCLAALIALEGIDTAGGGDGSCGSGHVAGVRTGWTGAAAASAEAEFVQRLLEAGALVLVVGVDVLAMTRAAAGCNAPSPPAAAAPKPWWARGAARLPPASVLASCLRALVLACGARFSASALARDAMFYMLLVLSELDLLAGARHMRAGAVALLAVGALSAAPTALRVGVDLVRALATDGIAQPVVARAAGLVSAHASRHVLLVLLVLLTFVLMPGGVGLPSMHSLEGHLQELGRLRAEVVGARARAQDEANENRRLRGRVSHLSEQLEQQEQTHEEELSNVRDVMRTMLESLGTAAATPGGRAPPTVALALRPGSESGSSGCAQGEPALRVPGTAARAAAAEPPSGAAATVLGTAPPPSALALAAAGSAGGRAAPHAQAAVAHHAAVAGQASTVAARMCSAALAGQLAASGPALPPPPPPPPPPPSAAQGSGQHVSLFLRVTPSGRAQLQLVSCGTARAPTQPGTPGPGRGADLCPAGGCHADARARAEKGSGNHATGHGANGHGGNNGHGASGHGSNGHDGNGGAGCPLAARAQQIPPSPPSAEPHGARSLHAPPGARRAAELSSALTELLPAGPDSPPSPEPTAQLQAQHGGARKPEGAAHAPAAAATHAAHVGTRACDGATPRSGARRAEPAVGPGPVAGPAETSLAPPTDGAPLAEAPAAAALRPRRRRHARKHNRAAKHAAAEGAAPAADEAPAAHGSRQRLTTPPRAPSPPVQRPLTGAVRELLRAAAAGDDRAARRALESGGASVHSGAGQGLGTAAHQACLAGHARVLASLLEHDESVGAATDGYANRPLHVACEGLQLECARALLLAQPPGAAQPHASDGGTGPAPPARRPPAVHLVNAPNAAGDTALHVACTQLSARAAAAPAGEAAVLDDGLALVELLLAWGADAGARNGEGLSASQLVALAGEDALRVLQLLRPWSSAAV